MKHYLAIDIGGTKMAVGVVDDDGNPRHLPWEHWAPGDEVHTSAWMRATSPGGDADYEDRINWSAELGYGVRAAEAGQSAEIDDDDDRADAVDATTGGHH